MVWNETVRNQQDLPFGFHETGTVGSFSRYILSFSWAPKRGSELHFGI